MKAFKTVSYHFLKLNNVLSYYKLIFGVKTALLKIKLGIPLKQMESLLVNSHLADELHSTSFDPLVSYPALHFAAPILSNVDFDQGVTVIKVVSFGQSES